MKKLQQLKQKRAALIEEMRGILTGSETANRDLTVEEQASYDAKKAEVEGLRLAIEREEQQLALEAQAERTSTPVDVTPAGGAIKREKGDAVARFVRSLAVASGDHRRAAEFCENTLHDPEVARALAASGLTSGGAFVPENLASEFIELLTAMTVVRRLGARPIPLPNGNLTMPKVTGGATVTWLGENTNITKTEQTFGQVKLSAKKCAAVVPISNDIIRFTSPAVDAIVRQDLLIQLALAQDLAFIRGAGTSYTPLGLRYMAAAANVIAVNATVNLANITQDLGKLDLALANANVKLIQPGYIMAPRTRVYLQNLRDGNGNKAFPEMDNGKLRGYPFAETTQIPINLAVTDTAESELYLVDFADILIGEVPGLIIESSNVAAYHDGSAVVSAFSLDQTVVKVIQQVDINTRHAESIAVLKDVDWA